MVYIQRFNDPTGDAGNEFMHPISPAHGEAEKPEQEISTERLYTRYNKANFPFLKTPSFVPEEELTGYKHTPSPKSAHTNASLGC